MPALDVAAIVSAIDQTLLKPTVGLDEGRIWVDENAEHGFAALCVSPFLVPAAAARLAGSSTVVCSVAGFPLGYTLTESKVSEAVDLVKAGCVEVDMVMNFAALIAGDEAYVRRDIAAVVDAVREAGEGAAHVKVILETGHLEEADIERGSVLAAEAGASFVKTSTGFGPRGASVRDVEVMRAAVGDALGVKAAGGIRDLDTALSMLEAGASRIGTSAGAEIAAQARSRGM
jgi:deoxyribose-phosphate aldolase